MFVRLRCQHYCCCTYLVFSTLENLHLQAESGRRTLYVRIDVLCADIVKKSGNLPSAMSVRYTPAGSRGVSWLFFFFTLPI